MTCIQCENLSVGYERPVARGLSFTVHAGDYLCIVGENGAGKTTLLKTLLGLQKPLSGTLVAGGNGVRRIGYLPQQASLQKDFPATVQEIVRSGCLGSMGLMPFYGKPQKQRADRIMGQLGIRNLATRSYRELSGGQQQRVLLARALCATDSLLFLDEPVAGLDPAITADFYALIQQYNKGGMTVVMITHDIPQALKNATHILCVGSPDSTEGNGNFFGTVPQFKESPCSRAFLKDNGGTPWQN